MIVGILLNTPIHYSSVGLFSGDRANVITGDALQRHKHFRKPFKIRLTAVPAAGNANGATGVNAGFHRPQNMALVNLARRACGTGTDSHAGQIERDHRLGTTLADGEAGCTPDGRPGPKQQGIIAPASRTSSPSRHAAIA